MSHFHFDSSKHSKHNYLFHLESDSPNVLPIACYRHGGCCPMKEEKYYETHPKAQPDKSVNLLGKHGFILDFVVRASKGQNGLFRMHL